MFVTRFAPSPTGPLHLGHAYSALLAHDMAMAAGGIFLLRIEDIDQERARPEWEAQIYDDLHWLGLDWAHPPMRQSQRQSAYVAALDDLWDRHLLFPCACSRRDLLLSGQAPQEGAEAVHDACHRKCTPQPGGVPYPPRVQGQHLRLDMRNALALCKHHNVAGIDDQHGLSFQETGPTHRGTVFTARSAYATDIADVVIARRDIATSYHLSVVVDDAAQGITHVVRGEDLFEATRIHVLLQKLLHLPTPIYHHHRLIRDEAGKRLAKRDDARALAKYRAEGATPTDIRRLVGLDHG
ncbi:tRNA glutamyl-Q(34) synthetase GluQRS [Oceaniglobus ichthyenteri]|uniref:tRNA glutamyl-Q(34) synthetase GluQRS n=1 Tax=Oceaniglobus ichthyenteri TaxID=2136177 RepID=UPI000D386446|nr:tRNA glutamyl-Q(34) synthetase GluQRS [Oceaniglobus ichthyenteri]